MDDERRGHRRMMVALFAAGIATFVDLYAVQGVLPEISKDLRIGAADAALTVSVATGALAIGVLGWAWVADRIGRLTSMRIAVIAAVALSVGAALAPDFATLLVLRGLSGAVLGAVPVLAVAYVHERLGGARAAAAATVYISGTTIGGAAGRLIAGPLAPFTGWRDALLVVAAISLLSGIAFILLAPPGARPSSTHVPQLVRIRSALSRPALLRFYLQAFLLTGTYVAVYNYLAFRLEAPPFGIAAALASLIFLAYFAGTVSSRIAGSWLPRLGAERTILIGLASMLVGLGLMSPGALWVVILGLVLFTAGFFLAHASAVAATGFRSGPDFRGQAGALYNVGFYLGSGIVGWAIGLVFDAGGWGPMSLVTAAPIALAALMAIPGALRRRAGDTSEAVADLGNAGPE